MKKDSSESPPPSSDTVSGLAARMQKKLQEESEAMLQLTLNERQLLESALSQLSSDVLASTKAVTSKRLEEFKSASKGVSEAARRQQQQIQNEIEAQTRRMLWFLKLPMMAMLIVFLLSFAGIWIYWQMNSPYELQTMANGKSYQVLKSGGWTSCQLSQNPPITGICRPVSN